VGQSDFSATEEIHESFPIEPIATVMGPDGLPMFTEPDPDDAIAIPFTYETQLCIEDDRTYVEVWEDEEDDYLASRGCTTTRQMKLRPRVPVMLPRSRWDDLGVEKERRVFPSEAVVRYAGFDLVYVEGGQRILVRPLRERCRHYKRQAFSNDSQPNPRAPLHQLLFRVCTARRSNGGAYMSLRDEAIYACDFRDPPDLTAIAEQDAKDKKKLLSRPDLVKYQLFGLAGDDIRVEDRYKK
jgi:hypothetical protein